MMCPILCLPDLVAPSGGDCSRQPGQQCDSHCPLGQRLCRACEWVPWSEGLQVLSLPLCLAGGAFSSGNNRKCGMRKDLMSSQSLNPGSTPSCSDQGKLIWPRKAQPSCSLHAACTCSCTPDCIVLHGAVPRLRSVTQAMLSKYFSPQSKPG